MAGLFLDTASSAAARGGGSTGADSVYGTGAGSESAPRENAFVIITVAANDEVRHIHDRMPAILDTDEKIQRWLDPSAKFSSVQDLLTAFDGRLLIDPVSADVGSIKNDDPSLCQPLSAAAAAEAARRLSPRKAKRAPKGVKPITSYFLKSPQKQDKRPERDGDHAGGIGEVGDGDDERTTKRARLQEPTSPAIDGQRSDTGSAAAASRSFSTTNNASTDANDAVDSSKDHWTCPTCTLHNEELKLCCLACGLMRPSQV